MDSNSSTPSLINGPPDSKTDIMSPQVKEPSIESIETAAKKTLKLDHNVPCHRISEGTHHAVYAIGEEYIARCLPTSERAIKNLHRDAVVQALAKKYVQNPELIAEVVDASLVVGGWTGNIERRIKGVSLQESTPTEKTAGDLAKFLIDMTSVPVEKAVAATGCQQEKVNLKARVTRAVRAWEEMVEKGYAVDPEGKMQRLIGRRLENLATWPEQEYLPCFVHADLNTENILIDRQDGSIAGIIDWSDAIVGDPCIDLSGVIFAIGPMRARRVAKLAEVSEAAFERAWLYTMTVVIRDLRDALCDDDEQGSNEEHLKSLLREEFRRVFDGTGMEDMLVQSGK